MEKILATTILAVALVFSLLALQYGVKQTEIGECQTWSKQSREYPNFTYSKWQRMQCDAINKK